MNAIRKKCEMIIADLRKEFGASTGARWHDGSDTVRRGWYLPDGTFLGASVKKARATFESL